MPFAIPRASRPIAPVTPSDGPPPPAPGLIEGFSAATRNTVDHVPFWQENRLREAYTPIVAALSDDRWERISKFTKWTDWLIPTPSMDTIDHDKVWAEIAKRRASDPGFMADIGTREEFERKVLTRNGAQARDAEVASRAPWLVQLAGGAAGSFADPVNVGLGIATGGLSKGVGLAKGVLIDGLANVAAEAAQTPQNMAASARLGEKTTAGDVAMNLGAAFAMGGAFHAAGRAWDARFEPFAATVAKHWDSLPGPLQERLTRAAQLPEPDDMLVADVAEAVIGRDRMSDAERAAADVLRREAQIAEANPFAPNGAGLAFHQQTLGMAINRLLSDVPPEAPRKARMMAATAVSSRTVAGDIIDSFMRKSKRVESRGINTARPRDLKSGKLFSSALGPYQFLETTWLTYYKKRFGAGGLSDAQILGKRTDEGINDILMRDLTEDNAAFLRARGEPVTEGNLYLAHFAGQAGARKLFDADPRASAKSVLGRQVVKANPFLRKMSAGEVLAWADRKMGGRGMAARGGGLELSGEAAGQAGLRAEIDRLNAESAQIRAQLDSEAPRIDAEAADLPDMAPVEVAPMVDGAAPTMADAAPIEPRAMDYDAPPPEVLALLPRLRETIDDRTKSLNQLDALASELGANVGDVRRGLTVLAAEGRIAMRRDNGKFMRKPPMPDGPVDVLDFIAKHGGIRDDEGHALGLVGLSSKQKENMISAATRRRAEDARRSGRGSRNWQRMTRRNGPLLRHNGQSIDRIGELLDEAGYLHGQDGGRPTTTEVLDYLDQRILDGKPRYTGADAAAVEAQNSATSAFGMGRDSSNPYVAAQAIAIEDAMRGLHGPDVHLPIELLDEAARLAAEMNGMGFPIRPTEAWQKASDRLANEARWDAFDESGDHSYLEVDYHDDPNEPDLWTTAWYEWIDQRERAGRQNRAAGADRGGSAAFASDPRQGGTGPEGAAPGAAGSAPALADLPPEETTRFIDPHGDGAQAQVMSLEHDARAAIGQIGREDLGGGSWVRVIRNADGVEVDYNLQGWGGGHAGSGATLNAAIDSVARRIVANEADSAQTPTVRKAITRMHSWLAGMREGEAPPQDGLDLGAQADPNAGRVQRQKVQLAADAPLRGENRTGQAQDGTMGLGLFDAADQPKFLLEEGAVPADLKTMLDEFDAEAAEIQNARDCL